MAKEFEDLNVEAKQSKLICLETKKLQVEGNEANKQRVIDQNINEKQFESISLDIRCFNIEENEANRLIEVLWTEM